MFLSMRTAIAWFGLVTILAGFGALLTYQGPFTSAAWRAWSGEDAWILDVIRLFVTAGVAGYVLWQFGYLHRGPMDFRQLQTLVPGDWTEKLCFIASVLLFIWGVFWYLPNDFSEKLLDPSNFEEGGFLSANLELKDIHERMQTPEFNHWNELIKPAFPYFIYRVGFWYGIVWLIFLSILRSVRRDLLMRRNEIREFWRISPARPFTPEHATPMTFDVLTSTFRFRVNELLKRAQRNLSVLLILVLYVLYEQLTPSRGTILPQTVEFGKLVLWFLLIPVLSTLVAVAAIGYQKAVNHMNDCLLIFAETLVKSGANSDLLAKVWALHNEIVWSRGPGVFVFSVVKSTNIAILLLVSLIGYVVHSFTGGQWIDIFVPNALVEFVRGIYAI